MLENYGGTPSTEKGLLILIDSYNSLNMRQLASDTARVLKKNYPEYKIEEVDKNILVSKIDDGGIELNDTDRTDSWYNIFNIFNIFK